MNFNVAQSGLASDVTTITCNIEVSHMAGRKREGEREGEIVHPYINGLHLVLGTTLHVDSTHVQS